MPINEYCSIRGGWMKKINDQKQLTRSEIQSAILYACLCTYDELEKREISKVKKLERNNRRREAKRF